MKTKERFQVKPGSYLRKNYITHKFKTEDSLTDIQHL